MKTTKEISTKLKEVEQEIKLVSDYMIENSHVKNEQYLNPRTGQPVPGASDDYTFDERLSWLCGERSALKFVLGKN